MPCTHLLFTIAVAATATAGAPLPATPVLDVPRGHLQLLDHQCDRKGEWRRAVQLPLSPDTTLLVMHDPDAVYLCILGPPDSHNTLDLYLASARQQPPINLHASAQVGERQRAADPEAGYGEYSWGNHHDWYSPPVPFRGMQGEGGQRRPDFATGVPREVAIRKSRFGDLPWHVLIEVGGSRNHQGEWTPLRHPDTASLHTTTPEGWLELRAGN